MTPIPGVGLTQSQIDGMYALCMALEQKAKAVGLRLVERDFELIGGRLEDILQDASYLASYVPSRAREQQLAELDRRDQRAT